MSRLQVLLNYPRTELLKEGWEKSRLASSIQAAEMGTKPGSDEQQLIPTAISKNLWQEPNTGVIMLRPGPLNPQWWEDTSLDQYRMSIDDWSYGSDGSGLTPLLAAGGNFSMLTRRASKVSDIIEMQVDLALMAILDLMDSEMRWVMQTKTTLYHNEGFSMWLHPMGIYTDRATDYMLIAFGNKYVLHMQMNGSASLYAKDRNTGDYKKKVTFSFAQGGVDHTKPFQLTVIPWGRHYITFLFSQSTDSQKLAQTAVKAPTVASFLYNISKYEGGLDLDQTFNTYMKTEAAPLSVAIRRKLYNYGFSWARVRYPSTATLTTLPESIPEIKDVTPDILLRGYDGQISYDLATQTSLTVTAVNGTNGPFNGFTDTLVASRIVFNSDSNKIYTPELWSIDYTVEAQTHTPDWTPLDISDRWTMLRIQRGTDPDQKRCEVKLQNDPGFYGILSGWGPLRVNCLDQTDTSVPIFDGYIYHRQPTLEGFLVTVADQISARDMWIRLNEMPAPDSKFLDSQSNLVDTIKAYIKKAGFLESDINLIDPNGYLSSIQFGGFTDPNDQKGINMDGSCGDVLREILKLYTPLPIRVRPVNGKWDIYLAPQYNPATPPSKIFLLKSGESSVVGDLNRFLAGEYYITTYPEWTVEEPDFNALIVRGATTTGQDAEAIEAVIPWVKADPRSVQDSSYAGFMGRAKVKTVGPPDIPEAQTQGELNRCARAYWDQNRRKLPLLEFGGEWQPEVDCDDFIWIIGVNPQGQRVSYGAYRIETLDVQFEMDGRDESGNPAYAFAQKWSNTDVRWSYQGNYTCVYVGKAEDANTPMFAPDAYLPII
jgi:hypothetical protein